MRIKAKIDKIVMDEIIRKMMLKNCYRKSLIDDTIEKDATKSYQVFAIFLANLKLRLQFFVPKLPLIVSAALWY